MDGNSDGIDLTALEHEAKGHVLEDYNSSDFASEVRVLFC